MQTITARIVLAICFLSLIAPDVKAQNHSVFIEPAGWSLGMNVGMSDLWADVGTKSPIYHYDNSKYWSAPKFMGGMFAKYTVHPSLAVRLSVNYGTLYATDAWNEQLAKKDYYLSGDAVQRYERNQNIKDIMWEGSVIFEYTPFRSVGGNKISYKVGQPYILAGIGYFHYTPYGTYVNGGLGKDINLSNLHLEGDGWGAGYPPTIKYWQGCIPVGIGYRWDMGMRLNLGIEYQYRFCFTDYLDMVSGKYVSSSSDVNGSVFQQHGESASQAVLSQQMSDKTTTGINYYNNQIVEAPIEAGYERGNPNNKDSYSTISIILYFKVKSRSKPWWGDWFY